MKKSILIIFVVLSTVGCTKKEYVDEYFFTQPISTTQGSLGLQFDLNFDKITDNSVEVIWNTSEVDNTIYYDLAINDSVVAYDLKKNKFEINELSSNTDYKITVIALDSSRNHSSAKGSFRTRKTFLEKVISLRGEYHSIRFDKSIKTSDNGLLIGGILTESIASEPTIGFVMKVDKDHNIEWLHNFNTKMRLYNLFETKDGNYIVLAKTKSLSESSMYKLNNVGEEMFIYRNIDFYTMEDVGEDSQGNLFVVGTSHKNRINFLDPEYAIAKVNTEGQELWFKLGGNITSRVPKDLIIESNGNLLIFGTADTGIFYPRSISQTVHAFWLLWIDENGDFIKEETYPNVYNRGDLADRIIKDNDGYLLFGISSGFFLSLLDTRNRFLKVSNDGLISWDNYYNLNSGGGGTFFKDVDVLNDDKKLILSEDDRGIAISKLTQNGEIDVHIKLYGYPDSIGISVDDNENYKCITDDGRILIFNHDGYIE